MLYDFTYDTSIRRHTHLDIVLYYFDSGLLFSHGNFLKNIMTGTPKLLTEPEAAEILRCSPYTVARIRKAGKLAYIPGRPVLIDEADLLAYIDNKKLAAAPTPAPEPGTPEHQHELNEKARTLARKMWMKRRLKALAKD